MATPALAVLIFCATLFLARPSCAAIELYYTDFENFPMTGADKWAGVDGWIGNNTGDGVHGIDQDIVQGLGKTGYIGVEAPTTFFTRVHRVIGHDPVATGLPIVQYSAVVGIQDSVTSTYRDHFYLSIYNSAGNLLGALKFDNTDATFGIWRNNGTTTEVDTGAAFINGVLHDLLITIDLENNRWSALLDNAPVFVNADFNQTTAPLNLGLIAAEWLAGQITTATNFRTGDNWMLLDFISLSAFGAPAFTISGMTFTLGGEIDFHWTGQPGFIYQVEYSLDMKSWFGDLPNSEKTVGGIFEENLEYTDPAPPVNQPRYYRIERSNIPNE
jgi:hypothetical protein